LMAASASRIAPDTHQDQASARVRPAPWRHGRPRRTLVPSRIQKEFHRTVVAGRHYGDSALIHLPAFALVKFFPDSGGFGPSTFTATFQNLTSVIPTGLPLASTTGNVRTLPSRARLASV
jgi:hypothetical protein